MSRECPCGCGRDRPRMLGGAARAYGMVDALLADIDNRIEPLFERLQKAAFDDGVSIDFSQHLSDLNDFAAAGREIRFDYLCALHGDHLVDLRPKLVRRWLKDGRNMQAKSRTLELMAQRMDIPAADG